MFSIYYEKFVLSNGLEVILHEDHTLPMVAVNVWYHVGSKNEQIGRTGFAHLFEHIMFEGSKHHNHDYFAPLQKIGATVNGSTTSDRTNYWENLPSEHLDLALWLESDRMGFLLDAMDQKRFDIQRDVVKNERRQSYENRPYGIAHLKLQSAVFPPPHPYSWPVIGSQEDLATASLEDVKLFFHQFYSPSNASLAIAGDFDKMETKRKIESYFGDLPPGPTISRIDQMESPLRGEVKLNVIDKVQLPRLYLAWPSFPIFDDIEAPADILATLLGDGKSSRLYRTLVQEKQIARDINVGSFSQEIAGEFHIQATANPDHTLEEIEIAIEAELEKIRSNPPSENELQRAKNRIENGHIQQLESIGGFGGRADQLNFYNVFAGNPDIINSDIDRYLKVDSQDIQNVASSIFTNNKVTLRIMPEKSVAASNTTIDRSIAPSGSKRRKYSPPVPTRSKLKNDLNIVHVKTTGPPIVNLGIVVRGGAITDPINQPGLAHITSAMLPEGTTKRSSQQIAQEMEFLGTHLNSSASREHSILSVGTLTPKWAEAMTVLADLVKNASFPEQEFDRVRKEHIADLKRISDDASMIAQRVSTSLAYGLKTKFGHPLTGTIETVEKMKRGDLIHHFYSHCKPSNSTLIVVGNVEFEEVLSMAENQLGDWQNPHEDQGLIEDLIPNNNTQSTTIFLADKPGAPQSVIKAGQLTIPIDNPEYYSMHLLNYIFGGHPSSRLFMNLRQDKGYSYGYYSSIDWSSGPSAFFAGGSVETKVTKESIVETLKEFEDISKNRPITKNEYESSIEGILMGFPARFESQRQLLQQLSYQTIFGLSDDYYSHFIDNLQAVTLAHLHSVAAEKIEPNNLKVLVIGDKTVVEPSLRELGLPIISVDYDGNHINQQG